MSQLAIKKVFTNERSEWIFLIKYTFYNFDKKSQNIPLYIQNIENSPGHNMRASEKGACERSKRAKKNCYLRAKRVKFLSMKKLLIIITEKWRKEQCWIQNKKYNGTT